MEIFALRMQGMGYTGIARLLNKRGIPAPGAYLYQKGLSDRETYRDALWTAWNMKTILHSEVYLLLLSNASDSTGNGVLSREGF